MPKPHRAAALAFALTVLVNLLAAQTGYIKITNGSFKRGDPYQATAWTDLGGYGYTPYDIMELNQARHSVIRDSCPDGKRYVLMSARPDGSYEAIGQALTTRMQKGAYYRIKMDVAQDSFMTSVVTTPVMIDGVESYGPLIGFNPVRIKIWGCKRNYKRTDLLSVSPIIKHVDWRKYIFTFRADENYRSLIIEVVHQSDDIRKHNTWGMCYSIMYLTSR